MITNLLISIVFLFVSPLILPLNIMQISIRKQLYKLMVTTFDMELSTINTRNIKLSTSKLLMPIHFLWIGVLIGQIFTSLFFVFCIDRIIGCAIFSITVFLMDLYCKLRIYRETKQLEKESQIDIDDVDFMS